MEGLMQLFGGGKGKGKESVKNAIIALREQLKLLQKRETQLQSQIDEQFAIARKSITTNKAGKLIFTDPNPYNLLLNDPNSSKEGPRAQENERRLSCTNRRPYQYHTAADIGDRVGEY